jgi:hypothetical protein
MMERPVAFWCWDKIFLAIFLAGYLAGYLARWNLL